MRLGIFRQLIDRQFSKVPPPRLRWQQLIPPSVPPESHVILLKIVHPILPPSPPGGKWYIFTGLSDHIRAHVLQLSAICS